MNGADENLRLIVYRSLATSGTVPGLPELATATGRDVEAVRAGLHRLAQARHLVLGEDGRILMAHPFATIPLGFSVMGEHTLWWGGCAWDSFAIPHLVPGEPEVLVATRCPSCGKPHAWAVGRDAPPPGDQVAHFLVPAAQMWDDVVFTCGHQRLFCDEQCVDTWLTATGNTKGYVMNLTTLWRLASHWYDGRLDPGYHRRDPASAATYLRDAGLDGPFWGLPAEA